MSVPVSRRKHKKEQSMSNAMIGSTGGKGGHEFSDYLVPPSARIKEVHISAGVFVDSLQVNYAQAGALQSMPRIGGSGGRHHTFVLDDDEYITGISGRSGNYVDSLRIHTNKRTSDAFGGHGGEHEFQFVAPAGSEVAGFFGRADWYVDALGIYTREHDAAGQTAAAVAAPVEAAASKPKGRKKLVAEVPAGETAPSTSSGAKGRKPQAKLVAEVPATPEAAAATGAAPGGKRRTKQAAEVPAEGPADVVSTPAASGGKRKAKLPAEVPAEKGDATQAPTAAATGAKRPRAARKGRSSDVAPIEETVTGSGDIAASRFSEFAAMDADAPLPAPEPPTVVERTPRTDDLIKVEGIGPAIAKVFVQNGIYDLSDLAVTPVERLREILDAAGARFRMADPATWPEQASYGARGDWDGMYTLQARLKAGRRV
jgi:predicted flap endonuclease-1-like 5' DNA nuclease